jgi:hypothetical protein
MGSHLSLETLFNKGFIEETEFHKIIPVIKSQKRNLGRIFIRIAKAVL